MGARTQLLIFLLTTSVAGSSFGTVADEARFFDSAGRRAYESRKYRRALESFLLVHEIAPSPRSLYNIAVCADLAGERDAAFTYYREYLRADDSDPARRSDAEARAKKLEDKLALLEVTSDPPGAAIYVDRKDLGQYGVTPRTIVVGAGTRQVTLELEGHRAQVHEIAGKLGTQARLAVSLEPVLAEVAVEVTPASAKLEFLRNEREVAAKRTATGYRLPVGTYTVVATATGFAPARTRVVLREGATAQVALGLALLPRPTGRLLVATGGKLAAVYLDGRRVAVTPATLPAVSAGEHVVEVRSGSRSAKRSVRVVAGRATYVELVLGGGARSP